MNHLQGSGFTGNAKSYYLKKIVLKKIRMLAATIILSALRVKENKFVQIIQNVIEPKNMPAPFSDKIRKK